MSHRATNWAIQQRGLAPATKLVLWHLCDRHNPDYGCFPSQDQLAADAEISRASLNTHLDKLEQAGLIRRERRLDDDTKRQRTTRYFLGFEEEFTPNPCPDSGHGSTPEPCPDLAQSRVQNLDTNPVSKEPVITTARDAGATREGRVEVSADDEGPDLDAAEAACLAACGEGMTQTARAAITGTTATIGAWLKAGYDLELDVLPVIAERTANGYNTTQSRYGPHFQAINHRLRALGLKTYTQEEIRAQIAQAEIEAHFRNDPDAAINASKKLGANFILRGLITTQTGINPVLKINEVAVHMGFTLVSSGGKTISSVAAKADSYSGTDTLGMALTLVNEQADEVVAQLYNDYCRLAGKK